MCENEMKKLRSPACSRYTKCNFFTLFHTTWVHLLEIPCITYIPEEDDDGDDVRDEAEHGDGGEEHALVDEPELEPLGDGGRGRGGGRLGCNSIDIQKFGMQIWVNFWDNFSTG